MAEKNKKSLPKKLADNAAKGSYQGVIEDLFENMYSQRFKIYKMNFFRGMMFAFGGVIGGTILVLVLLWFLSLFNHLPIIGHFVETIRHSVQSGDGVKK